ncbi:DUF6414 family protein [Aerococcus vaginalis]
MKEIIYLDTKLINSFLAQFDKGLINRMISSLETGNIEEQADENGNSFETGISAGIFNAKASKMVKGSNSYSYHQNNLESQEIAFDDFALDILLDKIRKNEDLNIDFKEIDGSLRLYNFDRIKHIMDRDVIDMFDDSHSYNQNLSNQINRIKNSKLDKKIANTKIKELRSKLKNDDPNNLVNFDIVRNFGKLGDALYPNSCLAKINNYLMVCPKENFRVNEASLTLFNETDKKANCLAIKLYQRKDSYIKEKADGTIEEIPVETIAASAPTIMMDILLDNFNLSKKGDYVARPVAIYFG